MIGLLMDWPRYFASTRSYLAWSGVVALSVRGYVPGLWLRHNLFDGHWSLTAANDL